MRLDRAWTVMGAKVGQAASEAWAHVFILSEMEALGGSAAEGCMAHVEKITDHRMA